MCKDLSFLEMYVLHVCRSIWQLCLFRCVLFVGLSVPGPGFLGLRLPGQHSLHVTRHQLSGRGRCARQGTQLAHRHTHTQPTSCRRDTRSSN